MPSTKDGLDIAVRIDALDHFTGNDDTPVTFYLGLLKADGSELTVGEAPGYERQAITFGGAVEGVGDEADVAIALNDLAAVFEADGDDWPQVTRAAVFSAATEGVRLSKGLLSVPKTLADTQTLTFAVGSVTLSLDGQ